MIRLLFATTATNFLAKCRCPIFTKLASNRNVKLSEVKSAFLRTYGDLARNHTMQMAAALAYYFVLSLFPALIFLSAVVAYLPVPDLFGQAVGFMGRFLPPDSMGLVRRVLADVITPNRGAFLSFGLLGTLGSIRWLFRGN